METVHSATLQLCLLLTYLVCGATVWLLRDRFSRNSVYDRWIGAHLAGATLYLILLWSAYLPARVAAWLACSLIVIKGCLLLGSTARLLQQPVPWQAGRQCGSLLLLGLLVLIGGLPAYAYNIQLSLALGISAFYSASLAWVLLHQTERGMPHKLAGGLCAVLACYLLLYTLHLAASNPDYFVYTITATLLLPALLVTPILGLCFMAMSKEQELARLHQLATLDALTGVFNRRSFEELARKACAQHARLRRPLALLVIDLDHFKRINDTYGHSRGDTALKTLAELVTEQVRASDIFGRFGGEEFCLLLPDTADDGGREVAGKLCQQINTILLDANDPDSALSASIGVASLVPTAASDWQRLFELADSRLYRAKSAGRNQLVWAG